MTYLLVVAMPICSCSRSGNSFFTSHCSSALNAGPAPGSPRILPGILGVPVGGQGCLEACYASDIDRPDNDDAVHWAALEPTIATISPERNRRTRVSGVREGQATVRATILGINVDVHVDVSAPGVVPDSQGCP